MRDCAPSPQPNQTKPKTKNTPSPPPKKKADVSGAPVVDAEGALVGVLTESDIVWKGAGAPEDHFVVPPVFIGFAEATIWCGCQ
jgi:CBS domain-containing protein